MSKLAAVTTETFDREVLGSEVPVVVDFWAAWCRPCRMVAPVMDEIAREFEGSVKVVKVGVEAEPEIAERFGVSGIPTIAFFEPGQEPTAVVGALPREVLVEPFGLDRFSRSAA